MSTVLSFHRDASGHWSALLDCRHAQPIRHRPPYVNRPWVLTEAGRERHIGTRIDCKQCKQRQEQAA